MSYRFTDFIDLNRFRDLLSLLHQATGISISLVDADNQVILEVGSQRICKQYHRACPECAEKCSESNAALIESLRERPFAGQECLNGLFDYAAPVILDGQMLAIVYLGQIFHEPPDEARFREQARIYGMDEVGYLQAVREVPVIDRDQAKKFLAYLLQVTAILSETGRDRLRFMETTSAYQRSEERFRNLLETAPLGITVTDAAGKIILANSGAEQTLGLSRTDIAQRTYNDPQWRISQPDGSPFSEEELPFSLVSQTRQPVYGIKHIIQFPDGLRRLITIHAAPLVSAGDRFDGMIAVVEDTTERQAMEERVERQNASLRALTETTLDLMNQRDVQSLLNAIVTRAAELTDTPDGFLYLVNAQETALEMVVGTGLHAPNIGYPLAPGEGMGGRVWLTGEPLLIPNYDDWEGRSKKFRYGKPYSILGVPLPLGSKVIGVIGISLPAEQTLQIPEKIDLLTRFAHQAALALHNARLYEGLENELKERRKVETALRLSEDKFSRAFHISPDSININRASDGLFIEINEGFSRMTGYTPQETIGRTSKDINIWANPADREKLVSGLRLHGEVLDLEAEFRMKNGRLRTCLMSARLIEVDGEMCILSITRDISERKRAEEDLRRSYQITEMRLRRLTALRSIDQTITSGVDLHIMIREIIGVIRDSLEADCAAILIPSLDNTRLEVAAFAGCKDSSVEIRDVPITHLVLRQPVSQLQSVYLYGPEEIAAAGIQSRVGGSHAMYGYAAAPIVAKQLVKGVIEVFFCQPFQLDGEWKQFLGALAMQTAIAIENAELFYIKEKTNLQLEQANQELRLAYDETIKGWARALELRDKETKGHSDHVMELTLRLADWLGYSTGEVEHIRRGVFLHDIGKMGIPDSILFKPGPLSPEEWQVMRQHPEHAYEMLKDIPYLKPALEIPYSHHERWDGSGYPRGLVGDEIPFVARIFAVVDVWDALLSDRPYRSAWPREQVVDYLREQSGMHFDPRIVTEFLRMLGEEPPAD